MFTWRSRLALRFWLSPVIVAVALTVDSPVPAATTIYTYTDDSGTQNFTTELSSIPGKYQSQVTQLDLGPVSNPPVVPAAQRPPSENVRVVTASGEYRMGDHDTKSDAIRLAVEAAKRQALEQVATYLESITEVTGMELTRDEIRTYTAGIVMVVDQKISTHLDGDTIVVRADLTAQVDPDEVAQAIMALRENESAKTELLALRSETDQLRQQLDAANQTLAAAVSPEEVQQASRQREELLNQLQANALVSQAWTDWVYVTPGVYPSTSIGLQQVRGLLVQAQRLQPHNRHLPAMQHVIATPSAGMVPAPATPVVPPPGPSSGSLLVPPASAPISPSFPSAAAGTNALRPPIPTQALPPASSNAVTNAQMRRGPSLAPLPPLPSPLPPTLQQIHPRHTAQPNPPVLRAPYTIPHHLHQGGRSFGRAGGGGRGGGHR